jgi:hypothetical protein
LVLISGLVALAAAVAGAVVLVGRTRELLRTGRAFGRSLATATGRLDAEFQRLDRSGERAGGAGEDLSASLSQLAASRARLGVLLDAVGDVRASLTSVTSFLPPRK